MADITEAHSWERLAPNIGNNRKLERPFYFLVKSNLTITERDAYAEKLSALLSAPDTDAEKLAAFLGEYVRMGDEPLNVAGQSIASLADFLRWLDDRAASPLLSELFGMVPYANSTEGARALFFERRSSGTAFMTLTAGPKVERTRR